MNDQDAERKVRIITARRLLERTREELETLRFQFHHNEKNLIALVEQYEKELKDAEGK